MPLAVDITPQVLTLVDGGAPTTFTGYISYQTDEDWFAFQNPCPGANCGIQFQWTQPQSSVQVAFFNLQQDLDVNESFTYTGTTPTASLPGPQTLYFPNPPGADNPDCHQCSGAFTLDKPTGSGPDISYCTHYRLARKELGLLERREVLLPDQLRHAWLPGRVLLLGAGRPELRLLLPSG